MIRKAEPKDIADIKPIADKLTLNIPNFVWSQEDFIMRQITAGEYFVVEENGVILGIISLRTRHGKMHIETLAIRDGFEANGWGRELLTFAKQYAKEKGFTSLEAYSFYDYHLKEFYPKHGFALLGHTGSYQGHMYYCFEAIL